MTGRPAGTWTADRGVASRRTDVGAASVIAAALAAVVGISAVLLAFVGGVLVTVRRAESAADLAAVAGATALARGEGGCPAAAGVAARNGAAVSSCISAGEDVLVVVTVATPALLGRSLEVEGKARAGPTGPAVAPYP